MNIRKELLDELLQECKTPPDLFGEGGILKQLTTALVERALEAELSTHLGYKKHESRPEGQSNSRNGYSQKTIQGEFGVAEIAVPRDRQGEFEPQMVKKGQSRLSGLDEKIVALYARGMSVRDIQGQLQEMYGVEVSPALISNVTDAVIDEVKQWQNRPLDAVYPIVFLDCLVIKVRDNGRVINKSLYFALGVNMDGYKELLGMWISPNEGAKFWLSVLTEIRNRGVKDILIACVDGLTGFPNAIETVFPKTQVQLCIVHMVRNSVAFVPWQQRKQVCADLKAIYAATTESEAEFNLELFAEKWDKLYPSISKSWRSHWANIIPFFAFPLEIRRAIYTTNAIESMNSSLRKVIKSQQIFPSDEAAFKLVYLAMRNISKKWTMPIRDWKPALNRFAILFEDRFHL
jgi:putative transposase